MPDVNFSLTVLGRTLNATVRLPVDNLKPHEMLPILYGMTNAVAGVYAAAYAEQGRKVTCQAGCGACCRQVVPLSEMEALHLQDVVKRMPPQRRAVIEERFRDGQERSAEVLAEVRAATGEARRHAFPSASDAYFRLGIACPFLENESCGIYDDRPARCREYNVLSDPRHCASLDLVQIDVVNVASSPATALVYFGDGEESREARMLPMIDALDYRPSENPHTHPPLQLLTTFLNLLSSVTPPERENA